MAFTVGQGFAYLHKEYSTLFFDNLIFTFLGSQFRIHIYQLLSADKGNFSWQDFFDIIILYCHIFLSFSENTINRADSGNKGIHVALVFANDFFPVPLVYIYRMNIVQVFISTDRDHVGIETLTLGKAVFFQGISFPFGQGVYDLGIFRLSFNIKTYRALYAI